MKTSLLLVLGVLDAWAMATPVATKLEVHQARADNRCRLHDDVTPPGHCRSCATPSCPIVHNITHSDLIGVRCYQMGDTVNRNKYVT